MLENTNLADVAKHTRIISDNKGGLLKTKIERGSAAFIGSVYVCTTACQEEVKPTSNREELVESTAQFMRGP